MDGPDDIVERIYDHVFGSRAPTAMLLEQGRLPQDWAARYLQLLEVAAREWRDQPLWPSRLVTAIHFVSWYLQIRYDAWRTHAASRSESTERELASLRTPSELFLMRPLDQGKPDRP